MGMMFQKGGLFSDLSVFENVAFPIREHTKLPEELIHDLVVMKLHAVGLRGAQRLMPAELSGGMSRRVALARAIALDPPLIIYDEPFAGLDPITLNVVCNLIRTLNDALGGNLGRGDLRRARGGAAGRLPLHPRRRRRSRATGPTAGDARLRPIRSCTSSCTPSPTGRCVSTIRRAALQRGAGAGRGASNRVIIARYAQQDDAFHVRPNAPQPFESPEAFIAAPWPQVSRRGPHLRRPQRARALRLQRRGRMARHARDGRRRQDAAASCTSPPPTSTSRRTCGARSPGERVQYERMARAAPTAHPHWISVSLSPVAMPPATSAASSRARSR